MKVYFLLLCLLAISKEKMIGEDRVKVEQIENKDQQNVLDEVKELLRTEVRT